MFKGQRFTILAIFFTSKDEGSIMSGNNNKISKKMPFIAKREKALAHGQSPSQELEETILASRAF